jgi:replicative DNA helicase
MTALYDAPPVEVYADAYSEPHEQSGARWDLMAERYTLGAMIVAPADGQIFDDIVRVVKPEMLYRPAHQEIAREIIAMREERQPVDPASLTARFMASRRLTAIGNAGYLMDLVTDCPGAIHGPHHAEAVRDFWLMRLMESVGVRMAQMGRSPATDRDLIPELYDTAIRELETARNQVPGNTRTYSGDLLAHAMDLIENPEQIVAIPTGYRDLDDGIYMGHRPGDLIIIGARPSTGKTLVGLDLARHAAIKRGVPTLFASIEMSTQAIMNRLIAAEARVNLNRIRTGACTDEDWARIAARVQDITDAPLCIDHTPNMTIAELDQAARDVQRERGLGLIVIDYLQKMTPPKADTEHAAIGRLAERVKDLGEKYDVPVIALAQLNRGPEQRRDRKPLPSDLGGSNKIEAHADTIMLLHREAQFDRESKRAGEIDILLCKQRDGATGEVTLSFQGHYSRCQSMATEWAPGGVLADGVRH